MICWLMNLVRKLHIHNWNVLEYERKDNQFFRKAKFRTCSCGLKQEKVCGKWGPIVNMETLKEAVKFEEDFRREFGELKDRLSDL